MGWNHFAHRVATVLRNVADRIDEPEPAPLVWWNPEHHSHASSTGTVRIKWPGHDTQPVSPFGLTPREREFVELLAQGKRTSEAAHLMNVKDSTARVYRRNACLKMEASGCLGLATRWLVEVELKRVYLAGYKRGWREARDAWERAWKH